MGKEDGIGSEKPPVRRREEGGGGQQRETRLRRSREQLGGQENRQASVCAFQLGLHDL